MAIEKARGISVATSVMTFEYGGAVFNLLDTPGHEDFSDDTYRTLTAVDSAIMVIDAARGIEARTQKLFEICRMRDIPIVTFINKLDREAREPLDLLDEIEKTLALDTAPMVWPVGKGRDFRGTYDLYHPRIRRLDANPDGEPITGPDDPLLHELLEPDAYARWREEIDLVDAACGRFDLEKFRHGALSPVFFGSALKNFGVRDVLDALKTYAPPPLSQRASTREIEATEPAMTGIVFKIQANMDPNHRDRIAFMRVCSGKLTRGMKVKHVRSGKSMAINSPQFFFAQDRSIAEEAFAGDVVGIPNRGVLRIGDALTEGEDITFLGIPSFAPEILRRIRLEDAIKARKLKDAIREMAEEGVVQVFSPIDGTQPIVGVIGALQLDVLADRLKHEYGLKTDFDPAPCEAVRWIRSKDPWPSRSSSTETARRSPPTSTATTSTCRARSSTSTTTPGATRTSSSSKSRRQGAHQDVRRRSRSDGAWPIRPGTKPDPAAALRRSRRDVRNHDAGIVLRSQPAAPASPPTAPRA